MLRNKEDVRRALRKELGTEPREEIWDEILERHYIDEAINDDNIISVLDFYRQQNERYSLSSGKRFLKTHHEEQPDEKMKYIYQIMIWDAAHEPEVIKFRKEVLKDDIIPANEAQNWINRQITEARSKDKQVELGKTNISRPEILLVNQDLSETRTRGWQEESEFRGLGWVDKDGFNYCNPSEGGILFKLLDASLLLEAKYTWDRNHATLFVLSGVNPPPPSLAYGNVDLNKSYPALDAIAVDLPIYLSPREMGEICARIKKALFPSNKRRNRPMTEKHLKLAVFYHTNRDLKLLEMMKKWNKEHPEYKKYESVTFFGRDAKSAYERLVGLK